MSARLAVAIAMGIGALISTIFVAVPSLRNGTGKWSSWELPGMIAVYLAGPIHDDIMDSALAWTVNAVVYGLVAFGILSIFRISN